jgi:hypothetical protein
MAKRRSAHKRSTKKRGGNWFQDLGNKIKNEFTNPQSVLRQQGGLLDKAASTLGGVPGVGQALSAARTANAAAKAVGLGRMRKYVKYIKSKSHGKRKSRR